MRDQGCVGKAQTEGRMTRRNLPLTPDALARLAWSSPITASLQRREEAMPAILRAWAVRQISERSGVSMQKAEEMLETVEALEEIEAEKEAK